MNKFKLRARIIFLVVCVVFLSLSVVSTVISQWTINNIHMEEEFRIMDVANVIAETESIRVALSNKDPQGSIQKSVEKMLEVTEHIEVIVVADMNGIRYGHNIPHRVGNGFVGGDQDRVVQTGQSYISEETGTLGEEIRAFVPIFDMDHHEQIGFVMVATFSQSIETAIKQSIITIVLASFVGLFIGIVGAIVLASNIKKILLGLEPEEISKLYVEKKGMLEALHEGIISVDKNSNITLINDSAVKILGIEDDNVYGINVNKIMPTSRLPEVINSGQAEYNQEQVLNNAIILTNRVPIIENGQVVGAIASFRDKTQVTQLAEEITGVKQVVEALRANTHEFMNKLHVILGLLQLEEYDLVKEYIITETEKQQQIISLIIQKIKNPTVAALILGKVNRAKELGIHIYISEKSNLNKATKDINNNLLITIIGNLLENSMDALTKSNKEEKVINLFILESEKELLIEIEDNGEGILKENLDFIFKRGFTSNKEEHRGVGLFLVKEALENVKGSIYAESEINQYTRFLVSIPKEACK